MITNLMVGLLALATLIWPGWWLARRAGLPLPLLVGLAGGGPLLLLLVLAADALSLPLNRPVLCTGWALVMLAAVIAGRRECAVGTTPSRQGPPEEESTGIGPWLGWLPLLPVLLIVAYRAIAQPLHGADTVFRWDHLARLMWAQASLSFYPPVTGADYAIYGWPDGIPPLVSTLYHWVYVLGGAIRPQATAPLVVFQVVLLFAGTRTLARREFSARAAFFAGLLIAAVPLAPWAAGMGQETGLTAISVLGLLLYLPRGRQDETRASVVAAAVCAALGALAREYGLIFPVLGFLLLMRRGLSPTAHRLFLLTVSLLVLPWYARNWLLTGHPLFNHALAGLFPINEAHARLMGLYQEAFSWRQLPPEAPRVFFTYGFTALFAGLAGAMLFFRRLLPALAICAVMLCLYVLSLGHTAGGYFYGLRLLNPAFALCAVGGGAALARWVPGRAHLAGVTAALCLLAADAALKNLTLPANPYRLPPRIWLTAGNAIHEFHASEALRTIARVVGTDGVIVLGPQAQLQNLGVQCAPPWSPALGNFFDPQATPNNQAHTLVAAGFVYVLTYRDDINIRYLAGTALFRQPLSHLQVVLISEDLVLYRIMPVPVSAALQTHTERVFPSLAYHGPSSHFSGSFMCADALIPTFDLIIPAFNEEARYDAIDGGARNAGGKSPRLRGRCFKTANHPWPSGFGQRCRSPVKKTGERTEAAT